jgi:hypothetical protein
MNIGSSIIINVTLIKDVNKEGAVYENSLYISAQFFVNLNKKLLK